MTCRPHGEGYSPDVDRMSALDAEFLHLEDSNSHMHIAGICTFATPRFRPPGMRGRCDSSWDVSCPSPWTDTDPSGRFG